jgi:hypothetical protein
MVAVAAATVASAVLSGWLLLPDISLEEGGGSTFGLYWGPGLYFGAAMAGCLYAFAKVPIQKCLGWLAVSMLAWRIALEMVLNSTLTAIPSDLSSDSGSSDTLNEILRLFLIPGTIGALVIAVGHGLLAARMSGRWVARATISGAVLSIGMYLSSLPGDDGGTARLILMFAIWQVGMGLTLDHWTRTDPAVAASPSTTPPPPTEPTI